MHVIVDIEQVLLFALLGFIVGTTVRWCLRALFPGLRARL